MAPIEVTLEYLQNLPLYQDEKPYCCFFSPHEGFDPDAQRLDNLEFEEHQKIPINNIRELSIAPQIGDFGFEVLYHKTSLCKFETADDVYSYRAEVDEMLKNVLKAEYVKSYDCVLRKNVSFYQSTIDLNDPLHIEGPARGVHNDMTYDSGIATFNRILSDADKARFLRPGYRLRIINTWRPLNPVLEDRPLALCDGRSVQPNDLIPSDRVLPNRVGEVYYLTYNPNHSWFWLEKQTSSEPFAFVMYDTKDGTHARFCPHVSFDNPKAPRDVAPRESVETRSIVITKE